MNTVINAKEIEMVSFMFCRVNIFGLVELVRLLMDGGIKDEKDIYYI